MYDYYVGIDQSLTGTGICVVDGDGEIVKMRLIAPPKQCSRGVLRLNWITNTIIEFISDLRGTPIATVREGYSYGSKGRSVFDLGELGGCIDLDLFRRRGDDDHHFVVSPSVMKKWILGLGNVKKDTGYLMKVMAKTKIQFPDDNQADAYMHAVTLRSAFMIAAGEMPIEDLTEVQKECFFSGKRMKTEGLTKANMKKLSNEEFHTLLSKVIADDYKSF